MVEYHLKRTAYIWGRGATYVENIIYFFVLGTTLLYEGLVCLFDF